MSERVFARALAGSSGAAGEYRMGAITVPADALLFHPLLNTGSGRGFDDGRDGGTRPIGELTTSLRVTASARVE
ncbi:MAG: hypothetical protein OXF76_01585 [Caldilineaceae bacterium]|nr:hypothetical protein [Caldilineaceae bacterium]